MKVVVFTDCTTCAYCKKIKPVLSAGSAFRAYLGSVGIGFDWGDRSQDPAHYAGLKRQYGFSGSYPAVYVIGDNGKTVARFVARNYTAQKLITKIGSYCASCNTGNATASKTKTCPTCKGSGVVAVALALMLSIAVGCVSTFGNYKAATKLDESPSFKFYRFAVLYPFAIEDVEFPNGVKIGRWSSTGGAAELVPLVDATGKLVGYVAAGAVKGAVK